LGSINLPSQIDNLAAFGGLLGAQSGQQILLFDAARPAVLAPIWPRLAGPLPWPGLNGADSSLQTGLWAALGDYGVFYVPLSY
jgi:hypothetical protein